MQFRISRVDIEQTRANWPGGDFAPALVLPRAKKDTNAWHVIDQPILLKTGEVPSWALASGDEYIRIPLFQYNLPPQADIALATMLQIGLICSKAPTKFVNTAHIVTGNPTELVYNVDGSVYCMTSWLGLALTFED
jgi:hypothetical protein